MLNWKIQNLTIEFNNFRTAVKMQGKNSRSLKIKIQALKIETFLFEAIKNKMLIAADKVLKIILNSKHLK